MGTCLGCPLRYQLLASRFETRTPRTRADPGILFRGRFCPGLLCSQLTLAANSANVSYAAVGKASKVSYNCQGPDTSSSRFIKGLRLAGTEQHAVRRKTVVGGVTNRKADRRHDCLAKKQYKIGSPTPSTIIRHMRTSRSSKSNDCLRSLNSPIGP